MKHPLLRCRFLVVGILWVLSLSQTKADQPTVQDPVAAAQAAAARRPTLPVGLGAVAADGAVDPIRAAQVLAAAEKTFPNLAADLENAELLRRSATDPSIRGNLRGRIFEEDWIKRNAKDGWREVARRNAPQNDAWRRVNGKIEGAQLKVRSDWHDYIRDMKDDDKAEKFVIPDDHYDLLYKELETRRTGAVRGGLFEKAADYATQQERLIKGGRTFSEVDSAIESAAEHFGRITKALRATGKAASFVGVGLSILDGSIAVYEVAAGKAEVDRLVARLGKITVGGAAGWVVGDLAADAAVAAGAAGAVPVAVAIVVSAATYLVVDWAIDKVSDTMKVGSLSTEDIKRVWPKGVRGIGLDQLYRKPQEPRALIKSDPISATGKEQ